MSSIMIISTICLLALVSVALGSTCDCDYHSGGCVISSPAARGFKCKCLYKGAWTCGGAAFPCSRSENCPGGQSDYCACKMGGGDCGAYRNPSTNCAETAITNENADCDCDYHAGGCSISTPAPENFKCVCVYKGAWTCSGWAQQCDANEYCGGGDYSYCACKQGGGDCGAYPDTSETCTFTRPDESSCDCNNQDDWSKGRFTIEKVDHHLDQVTKSEPNPKVVGEVFIPNNTPHTQTVAFTAEDTTTTTSSYEFSSGISIAVGTEFKAGIPLVGSATNSITMETSVSQTWGSEKSVSVTYSHQFTCNGGPHLHTRCQVILTSAEASIPYTMTLKHKVIPNCKCESKGVWKGVGSFTEQLVAKEMGPCKNMNNGKCSAK